ncbi:hypothetical protein KUM39_14445 [Streptomyces sp. J2-1]|uniref:hypothetical protein n=1 Tax=Streptomyces corallincola TaxID=2851888 RepID=UPI001C392C90|nr:hypothetical protein [Streptomyces corallincola]MBV2355554.1 hypothetical protein [Streptomyces corallincola]
MTTVTVRRLHKAGNTPDEYEDAAASSVQGGAGADDVPAVWRLAVADGATESAMSGEWARMLAGELCACPLRTLSDPYALRELLTGLADGWPARLRCHVRALGRDLHYWEPRLLAAGAAATVQAVAVVPEPDGDGRTAAWNWRAAAVGDCDLFHVRDGVLLTAFPLTRAEEFNRTPALVHSLNVLGPDGDRRIALTGGRAVTGDVLHLASDALALWALEAEEAGVPPWERLAAAARDTGAFEDLVSGLRARGALRNDDVTLTTAVLGVPPGAGTGGGTGTGAGAETGMESGTGTGGRAGGGTAGGRGGPAAGGVR